MVREGRRKLGVRLLRVKDKGGKMVVRQRVVVCQKEKGGHGRKEKTVGEMSAKGKEASG